MVIFALMLVLAQNVSAQSSNLFAKIQDLHPTQMNIGRAEAEDKAAELKAMSKADRETYYRSHPVPVVIGPGGQLFMIDHHHLSFAAWSLGEKTIRVIVVRDLSQLSEANFWKRMIKLNYVYLKDKRRPVTPAELPDVVDKMGDDRFRSLAGVVRKRGGYAKVDKPFNQFEWADFFRDKIEFPRDAKKSDVEKAIESGVALAMSPAARHLPGFRYRCEILFAP